MTRITTHVLGISFILIASLAAALVLASMVSPKEASVWQLGLMYSLIFAGSAAAATVVGFGLRYAVSPSMALKQGMMRTARRQGLILGAFAAVVLGLRASSILNIYSLMILLAIFILLELYTQ